MNSLAASCSEVTVSGRALAVLDPIVEAAQRHIGAELDVWLLPHEAGRERKGRAFRVDFNQVFPTFRPVAKDYLGHLLRRGCPNSSVKAAERHLWPFLRFMSERRPEVCQLHDIELADIDAFLGYITSLPVGRGGRRRTGAVLRHYARSLAEFLSYLHVLPSAAIPLDLAQRLPASEPGSSDGAVSLEHDIWDLRTVPEIKRHGHDFSLNFMRIPVSFRDAVKVYVREFVERRVSMGRQQRLLLSLQSFFTSYCHGHPTATDLRALKIGDMDACVQFLAQPTAHAPVKSAVGIRQALGDIITFLEHLKKRDSPLLDPAFVPSHLRGRFSIVNGQGIALSEARSMHPSVAGVRPDQAKTEAQLLAEDTWDVRAIPGAHWDDHASQHRLHFEDVPWSFRTAVKGFIRWQLSADYASSTLQLHLVAIRRFTRFFLTVHPAASSFQELTLQDIDAFLGKLQSELNQWGRPRTTRDRYQQRVIIIERFMRFLQRTDSPLAPQQLCDRLFVPGQVPSASRPKAGSTVKYLPPRVLQQLDDHISELHPRYLPVVVVLRASGWRISDVLNLRYDTCLEGDGDRWSLVGDIRKTKVLGHKVPITTEVAAVIQTQIALAKEQFPEAVNPKHYLFPSRYAQRWGQPLHLTAVQRALNRLAQTQPILGDDGEVFHFKTHVFRHTKAVELINNGMPLIYVQKWLAHLSPEMTLVYARILDTTMRRKWDEVKANGALKVDSDGRPEVIDPEEFVAAQELELAHVRAHLDATRVELGYCFKPKKMECPYAHTPCCSCPSFVTAPEFLPQFEHQERDTLVQIELGQAAGRAHWVDANQRKLAALQPLIAVLRQGKLHQPRGKTAREYAEHEVAGRSAAESAA